MWPGRSIGMATPIPVRPCPGLPVIPAYAPGSLSAGLRVQWNSGPGRTWIPAFAGMTAEGAIEPCGATCSKPPLDQFDLHDAVHGPQRTRDLW
jgi:hypothetical protein